MIIQCAPHLMATAGVTILVIAVMANTNGILNGIAFRLLPAAIGAACLWMSAAMFMAGTP